MTIDHFKKVVILFCVIALISFSCKKNDVPEEENSSSTQVNEKASPQKDDASTAQNMVVEVNGIKLTQKQVDEKMNVLIAAIKNQVPPDRIEEVTRDLREKVIADFITRTVVNQEADKHNITASEDEVNATLSKLEKNLPEDMTLKAVLTQGGMSLEDMRNDIIFSVRTNKLMESQIKDDTKPSDEEIKKYYTDNKKQFSTPETVHARHILMKADEKDDEKTKDEKKAIIEGLRKQLLEGADFEKLAKENSSCPSGKKGGDLGAFPRGRMAKPFEEAAFSQKVNDIGPIVQTRFGYHIIQVLAHNQATEKKLDDETKEKITATMVAKKKQELAKNYINKLKENAKIVYATEDTSKE
jgi:parvulin-like peptidyl-prolyl isomerase